MSGAEKTTGPLSPTPAASEAPPAPLQSLKISASHRARLAIVYIRQSSPHQVLENRESKERQYALADYAKALGWPSDRVLSIDEDQGLSGRFAGPRSGFQRLLAEVAMDHVGMILGIELNRMSRSNKDWHHLLELCALFGTLLADQDGIYDPNDPNDRLLLGLSGIMSEVELHTMRNRLERGRANKARRGGLFFSVPLGYVILPNDEVDLDPDEQARSVVQLLFDKFDEIGSAYSLWHWLLEHGISLPFRSHRGPNKGETDWRPPTLSTITQVLHNPIYAGAYAYGRRPGDPKRKYAADGRRRARWLPIDRWQVLIPGRLPAYITWERYLANQERLKQNQTRPDTLGSPRHGGALLAGLIVCGRCHWRMQVSYRTGLKPWYHCMRRPVCGTGPDCSGVSAEAIDQVVVEQILCALEPASLELSLKVKGDLHREHDRLDRHRKQSLKRARYDAELAERRYRSVDPENRLVVATLERQWEATLRQERELRDEYDRFRRHSPPELSEEDATRIRALASDIPALWSAAATTNADRKAIIRCLVERVVVDVERNSEHAEATIHWAGGSESRVSFVRPVRTYEQLRDRDRLMKRIVELREAGKTAAQTADLLNAEGFAPINPRDHFNRDMARDLLRKLGLRGEQYDDSLLAPDEWWIRDLAQAVGLPWQTLREWAINGWVHARQTRVQKLWILWADEGEVERLRGLRSAHSRGILGYPKDLTTPKRRPVRG